MRWIALALLAVVATGAAADDRRRPDVDVVIPVPPYEHERLHYFGKRGHHEVPGTVTINAAPYVCDLDKRHFRERDDFIAHLRRAHHVAPDQISERLLVQDGQVHFVTE